MRFACPWGCSMKPEQLLLMNMNLRGVSGLGALLQQKLKSGVVLRPERGLARPREASPLACSPCVLHRISITELSPAAWFCGAARAFHEMSWRERIFSQDVQGKQLGFFHNHKIIVLDILLYQTKPVLFIAFVSW